MDQDAQKPDEVVVYMENDQGNRQPHTFQLCPLGVQFYSNRAIPEFELMSFSLKVEGGTSTDEDIDCTGAVVRCQEVNEEDGRFRLWIKFLDAPENTCNRLKCVSRQGKHLCCFCESF